MEHICQTYFQNPNFYRIDGRPVIFLYLSRVLDATGVLGDLTRIMRDTAREVCNTEIFLLGDQVWGGAPNSNEGYSAFELLDAVTNYDIYGNMNNPPYAGQGAVDAYYLRQKQWSERAGANGVGYVPGVSPGYNDRGIRLQSDNIGLSRRLTPGSEPGTLFIAQLEQARYLVDPAMGNLLLVNSFNEWHEDSQIEPAEGEPTNLPLDITNGIQYEGYGELYLNILRAETWDAKPSSEPSSVPSSEPTSKPSSPEPSSVPSSEEPFSGPPPEKILVGAYYHAWSGEDLDGGLRTQLDTPQNPVLGTYESADPFVIAQHLEWSRQGNIGLWITSWGVPMILETTRYAMPFSHIPI
jgi:hypothetical protein